MFKLSETRTLKDRVAGLFATPIHYEERVSDGNWTPYFGNYQNQKWGQWDSNSCWCLSAINCAEDQLEYLYRNGLFSNEAKDFFTKNGYIDEDGDFSLSERFLEILSGVHDNGNNQMEAWILMQEYGCIPRSKLTYTKDQADIFKIKPDFNNDYFNKDLITNELLQLGQDFLKYVNISRQWIGTPWLTPDINILKAALKQAPLQIGVPVPDAIYNWNENIIQYDGKIAANHAVELYRIDENGLYWIFDQYMPNLKKLSDNYLLALVCQGILTPTPVVIKAYTSFWDEFWGACMNYYNGIINNIQIG